MTQNVHSCSVPVQFDCECPSLQKVQSQVKPEGRIESLRVINSHSSPTQTKYS